MAFWNESLSTSPAEAETQFDRLKQRLFGRLGTDKPYRIIYYRGFGSPSAVWLTGRVVRQGELSTPSDRDTFWQNLLATYQRFGTDAVADVTVKIEAFGQTHRAITDKKGFFEVTINPPDDLLPCRVWFPVRYSLERVTQPANEFNEGHQAVFKEGHLMISPPYSQFGVISDIDDTVLVTDATNLLQTAKLTFLGNAYTRLPSGE